MLSPPALAAPREHERQLRLALQAGAMGLWRIDLATSLAQWDEQVQRLQGWEPGTFPGTWEAFCSHVHPDDLPAVRAASQVCNELHRDFTVQFRVLWPDGSVRWIEDHGILDFDETGELTGITGLSMDITARKDAEFALRAAKERAECADAAKGEFLSRTSHELRTPLNAILGFGQLLELEATSQAQQESVEHILAAGRKLLGLVDGLLLISRGQQASELVSAQPLCAISPVAALTQARAEAGELAAARQVRLHAPTDETGGAELLAEPQALQRILEHLLRNAVQYNRPGGEVFLHAAANGAEQVRLSVRDTGYGLSPAEQERLFVPFDRLGVERRGEVAGVGLGLATSQQLAQEMGGCLNVSSVVGEGTTFWLELPSAEDPRG